MKLIITEDQKFSIIKKYWDKLSSQGKEPSISDTVLSLFHVEHNDLPDLQDFLVEYLGGYDVAFKKTIKILENLPPIDLDTGDIQSKWKYVQVKSVFSSSIGIDVVVFGENVQDTVEDMDMSEYFDFSDYISDQVGSDLYEFVTTKTGIDIYVSKIDYSNE